MYYIYLFEIILIGFVTQLLTVFFARNNIYYEAMSKNLRQAFLYFIGYCLLLFGLTHFTTQIFTTKIALFFLYICILYMLYVNYSLRKTFLNLHQRSLLIAHFILAFIVTFFAPTFPRWLFNILLITLLCLWIFMILQHQDHSEMSPIDIRLNNILLIARCALHFALYRFIFYFSADTTFLVLFLVINMCDILLLIVSHQFHQRLLITSDLSKVTSFKDSIHILNEITENSTSSIILTDLDANILYINQKAVQLTGFTKTEVLGQNPRIFSSGETDIAVYRDMWAALTNNQAWSGELVNKKKNGETYVEAIDIIPIKDHNNISRYFLAVKYDITLKRKYTDSLQYYYDFDELTGAYRRLKYMSLIEELRVSTTLDQGFLCMVDLNQFKQINDTYGHHIGDKVLMEFVKRAKKGLGYQGIVCRMGGDEFSLFLYDIFYEDALVLLRKLIHDIQTIPVEIDNNQTIFFDLSIGMTSVLELDSVASKLVEADQLLYTAKRKKQSLVSWREEKNLESYI